MNMRMRFPLAREGWPLSAGPLAPAVVAPLGPAAAALAFDEPAAAERRARGRLTAWAPEEGPASGTGGGRWGAIGGRSAATRLPLRAGGLRRVLLVRRPAAALAQRGVWLGLDGAAAAAIDPDWLESPLVEPAALLDGLGDDGRRRLLRLALTAGGALFGPEAAGVCGALAARLLDALGAPELEPVAWRPIGASGGVATWRAPAGLAAAALGDVVALAPAPGLRVAGAGRVVEVGKDGRLLHLHLSRPLPPGGLAVSLGARPLRLPAPGAARPLAGWFARRGPEVRAWAATLVEAAAAADPGAAALARELRHAAAPAPRLAARIAGTPRGLLVEWTLTDPHGLVAAIRFERGGMAAELPAAAEGAAHVALPRASALADHCRVRLAHRSGRLSLVHDAPVAEFRGAVAPGFGACAPEAAAAALARARLDVERFDVEQRGGGAGRRFPAPRAGLRMGAPPARPGLSVIAPAEGGLDMMRARAAMIAAERGVRREGDVEVILHCAEGAAARAARAAAAQAVTVFGVPHRVVALAGAADAGERLLAALAAAEGAAALLLGAEVLPAGPGWLAPWRRLGAAPVTAASARAARGRAARGAAVPGGMAFADAAAGAAADLAADLVEGMAADLVADLAAGGNGRAAAPGRGGKVGPAGDRRGAAGGAASEGAAGLALLGGVLLDHDGAVIDAGGAFGPGGIVRPRRGLPAADLPRAAMRPTNWVSAECAGLTRAAIDAVLAGGPAHPSADVLLGAAAARLRAEGARVATRLASRFVRYAPAVPQGIAAAADDAALIALVKGSFSPAGDEGACAR